MKTKFTISIILLLFMSVQLSSQNITINFVTLGNCLTCKTRIEATVNELSGIVSVDYNAPDEEATVVFNPSLMDSHTIMEKIAASGHDTEWYRGSDSAYNTLRGTCCEYVRRLNYSNVQIGYFSLMDVWETFLSVEELKPNTEVSVLQNFSSDIFSINIKSQKDIQDLRIDVYSIMGAKVYSMNIYNGNNDMNLSSLSSGQYITVVSSKNSIIKTNKIIKL